MAKLEEERKEAERIRIEKELLQRQLEEKEMNRYTEERSHLSNEDHNALLNLFNDKQYNEMITESQSEIKEENPLSEEQEKKELYIEAERIKSELTQRTDLEKIRLRKLIEEKERIQRLREEKDRIKREREERHRKQLIEEKRRKEEEYKEKIRKIEEEKERIRKIKEDKERQKREKEERLIKENEMKAKMQLEQEKREHEELRQKYEELLKRDIQKKSILPIKKVKSSRGSKTNSNTKLNRTNIQNTKLIKNLTFKLDEEEAKKNLLLHTEKNSLNVTTEEVDKKNPIFIEYNTNPISLHKPSQPNISNSLINSKKSSISNIKSNMNSFDVSSVYLNTTMNHKYNSTENISDYKYNPQITGKESDNEELSSFLTHREIHNNYKPKKIKDVKAKIRPLKIKEESFDSNYELNFNEYKNKVQSILSEGGSVKKYKHVRTSSLPIKEENSIKKQMKKFSTKSLKYSDDSYMSKNISPKKSKEEQKVNKSSIMNDNIRSPSKKAKAKIYKYSSTASMPSIIDINEDDVIFKKVPVTNIKKTYYKKQSTGNINSERVNQIKKRNEKVVSAFDKVSPSKATKQNEEPNHYKGVIDIRCISQYDIKESLNRVLSRLKQKNIFYVQTSLYKFRCSKQLTSFDIELTLIDSGLCYFLVKIKSGGVNANVDLISNLFN